KTVMLALGMENRCP
ncbi:hypothetical protein E2320_014117, partial [Naja naja]